MSLTIEHMTVRRSKIYPEGASMQPLLIIFNVGYAVGIGNEK